MKIGIIKETKNPVDNRVALTPKQVSMLNRKYPDSEIVVQSSEIRAYSDDEYVREGVKVVTRVDDCDILFGIKEAAIETLLPNKHYFFFGHIAKMQPYNKPLIRKFKDLKITFTDYEYLVDNNQKRLCAFGWWAGVVGVYNTFRAYGIREHLFSLPKPDKNFTLERVISGLKDVVKCNMKLVLTGNGRVSKGAQFVLDKMGALRLVPEDYLKNQPEVAGIVYTVLEIKDLVKLREGSSNVTSSAFKKSPELYKSIFFKYAKSSDVLISCHFWAPNDPVYLSEDDLKNRELKIKVIGDITCDIKGSIKSTVRSSTHDEPFYDYNPLSQNEEPAFSSDKNISVMAVDTLPNALAVETSRYFGDLLIQYVIEDICAGRMHDSVVIERATILKNGELTAPYSYLTDYMK